MDGGTGAGGHMWNIVQMDDGRNYLVDVTNCDEGTIGAPDKLFMAYGPSEVRTNGYTLSWSDGSGSSSIIYTYDSNTIATFGEARLTLSNTAYGVDPVAIIDSASVVFNGLIQLKYYFIIPDELLNQAGTALVFYDQNGEEVSRTALSEGVADQNGKRAFYYDVVAEEICTDITARILNANGVRVPVKSAGGTDYTESGYTYSVLTYARSKEQNSESEEMKALAEALDDYGVAAGIFFNGNSGAVDSRVSGVSESDLQGYELTASGTKPSGLNGCSISVMYEADNSLRIYYRFDGTKEPESYTYKVDNKTVPILKRDDNACYLTVSNIAAKHLGQKHTFTISDDTGTYTIEASAMSYALICILKGTDASKNLGKALYLYHQAAYNYFKNN